MVHTLEATAAEQAARRNHYEGEMVAESFWKKAAASLPPQVQRRHAHLFDAAERYEPVIDFIVELLHGNRSGRAPVKGKVRREVSPAA